MNGANRQNRKILPVQALQAKAARSQKNMEGELTTAQVG
jgi:hypothetical protein